MRLKKYVAGILIILTVSIFWIYSLKHYNAVQGNSSVKIIRIAGDKNYPPYEFLDKNGVYKGFNVDIMNSIAIELGINIEFIPMSWADSIKALQEGKIDAIQGMTKSEYRKQNFDFSKNITWNSQVIFVRKDTTYISGIEDLVNHSVAVQSKDINEDMVKSMQNIRVVHKENQEQAIRALMNGEVDAYIGNRLVGLYILQKNGLAEKVKIAGDALSKDEYCSATVKGNKEILYTLDKGISKIKSNGTYDKIYKKWFGEEFYDQNKFWRHVIYSALIGIALVLSIFLFIILLNKKLKAMVNARTAELIKVNSMLSQSEENYRRLFEVSPDAVLIHDRNRIIFANSGAVKLVGLLNVHELIGRPIRDFLREEDIKRYRGLIDSLDENERTIALNSEKIKRFDGTDVDVEIRITRFANRGKTIMLSIIKDLTDKKLLSEAIEYDKLKTEFFANISHELRTPLNVILATVQLLEMHMKNGLLDREKKLNKYLGSMKQNSYRLLRLVNNLIDITKIDADFYKLELKDRDIISLIENITLSVAEYVENKGISLIFDTDVEEKVMACDSEKIERIILNLLSNAVKFTPEGGTITVSINDKGEKIVISIKDTGIGIPEDKLEAVFERFRQIDKSLSRSHEGSGIGLSLVKALVEMHEGKVWIKSKLKEGSEFIVELPVRRICENDNGSIYSDEYSMERINIEFSDICS